MRKFLLMAVLMLAVPVFAQTQPTPPTPPPILKPAPAPPKKVAEYTKKLGDVKIWAKNLTNDKFYDEQFSFKDKKTDKETKFSEFPPFDRRMFQMTTTQRFNRHLDKLEETWQEELEKATGKVPDSKGKADEIAGADDLGKFIADLVKVRKDAVLRWEEQANSVFKDFPKEFTEKDKSLYLKNIKTLKDSLEGR